MTSLVNHDDMKIIIQDLNRFKKPRMKIETIQTILNRFKASQKDFMIWFKLYWIDSSMTRLKNTWNDSPQVRD